MSAIEGFILIIASLFAIQILWDRLMIFCDKNPRFAEMFERFLIKPLVMLVLFAMGAVFIYGVLAMVYLMIFD